MLNVEGPQEFADSCCISSARVKKRIQSPGRSQYKVSSAVHVEKHISAKIYAVYALLIAKTFARSGRFCDPRRDKSKIDMEPAEAIACDLGLYCMTELYSLPILTHMR